MQNHLALHRPPVSACLLLAALIGLTASAQTSVPSAAPLAAPVPATNSTPKPPVPLPTERPALSKAERTSLLSEGPTGAPLLGAESQRIERSRIEDEGSRIDELRYGGSVQQILVQPKFAVPAYEIQTFDAIRNRPTGRDGAPPTHPQRVWNVLGF
jgi:hypothetical protein